MLDTEQPHSLIEPSPMPGFEHYKPARWIRVSALTTYLRCPRLYFYNYGCGLVPLGESIAMKFGEAIHAGLGWLLGHEADVTGAMKAFDRVWPESLEAVSDTKEGKNRNRAVAFKMLLHWIDTHSGNRSIWVPTPPPKFSGPGILTPTDTQSDYEIPFAVDIGLPIMLVGRIDAMCRHRDTGQPWLVEFKTGSEFSWWLLSSSFENNTQALSYNLAMSLLGCPVRGTMVDLLLASARRQETQVVPTEIHQHWLDSHLRLCRWKIGELLEFEKRRDFPRDSTGCNTYHSYGSPGFTCDYSRLCSIEDWTKFKDLYRVEVDRPFELGEGTEK